MLIILCYRQEGALPYCLLIGLCALQSLFTGLNLGYQIHTFRYLQIFNAALIPIASYIIFTTLEYTHFHLNILWQKKYYWHILPLIIIIPISLYYTALIDIILILIYITYASLIFNKAQYSNGNELLQVRLHSVKQTLTYMKAVALLFVFSAGTDFIILLDELLWSGTLLYSIVSLMNGLFILILCFIFIHMDPASHTIDSVSTIENHETSIDINSTLTMTQEECQTLFQTIDSFVIQQQLFHNPDLNLAKLARKVAIPARKVSQAINRMTNMSVSQYINHFRIEEASARLIQSDDDISTIMFAVGFQTKSNFNREFLRLKSVPPSIWRKMHQQP